MVSLIAPNEALSKVATQLRARRIALALTQVQLSERANVSLAVLRKFERTGKISLESFVKLGFVLGLTEKMLEALSPPEEVPASLDELLSQADKPERKYAYSPRKTKRKEGARGK